MEARCSLALCYKSGGGVEKDADNTVHISHYPNHITFLAPSISFIVPLAPSISYYILIFWVKSECFLFCWLLRDVLSYPRPSYCTSCSMHHPLCYMYIFSVRYWVCGEASVSGLLSVGFWLNYRSCFCWLRGYILDLFGCGTIMRCFPCVAFFGMF